MYAKSGHDLSAVVGSGPGVGSDPIPTGIRQQALEFLGHSHLLKDVSRMVDLVMAEVVICKLGHQGYIKSQSLLSRVLRYDQSSLSTCGFLLIQFEPVSLEQFCMA